MFSIELRHFVSYSTFGIVSSAINFATIPFLTRHLSPEAYGVIGLFMAALYFLTPALSFSAEGLIGINKVNLNDTAYRTFTNSYLSIAITNFTISLMFAIAAYLLIFPSYLPIILLPFISITQSISKLHSSELVHQRQPIYFGGYTTGLSIILLLFTVIGVSILNLSWEGRIIALLLAELIILYSKHLLTFDSLRFFNFYLSANLVSAQFRYGRPLLLILIASWMLNQADRFIVLNFLTLSDVGIYTAAYGIGNAVNIANNAMTNSIVPRVYKLLKAGNGRNELEKITNSYSIFIFCFSLSLAILFGNFGDLILGEQFKDGTWVVCFTLMAFGFNGMYRTVGLPLDYYKLTKLKAVNFYIAAILNIVLSILLIGALGVIAPAIGTMIAFIVLYLLTFYHNRHQLNILSE